MQPLNLVFAGTPEFAAQHLQSVLQSQHRVVAVYTQPDRRSGRGKKLLPSPVKSLALDQSIPVLQPASLKNEEAQKELAGFKADLMVVVAYGLILPEAILQTPRYGCINVHASLLPRWRGAAPVERTLLAGDRETGVTIMQMDAGLDTGDMLLQVPVSVDNSDNRLSLEKKLAKAGTKALLQVLDRLTEYRAGATKQNDALSTYAEKISKPEAQIDWNNPASQINQQLKAGIGRYPAYSILEGERVRFIEGEAANISHDSEPGTVLKLDKNGLEIACGEGAIIIGRIQLSGKKPVTISDLLNSNQSLIKPGTRFAAAQANHL